MATLISCITTRLAILMAEESCCSAIAKTTQFPTNTLCTDKRRKVRSSQTVFDVSQTASLVFASAAAASTGSVSAPLASSSLVAPFS